MTKRLPKPYYKDAAVQIFLGDCRELLPSMPDVDVVLTDPPYGIPITDYNRRRTQIGLAPSTDYPDLAGNDVPFDPQFLLELEIPTLLFGANHYADQLPPSTGWIVWDKQRPENYTQATAELAWTNFVKGVRVFRYLWHGMIRAGNEPLAHPTMKPVALWHWILSLTWMPDGLILDPFMGSGTTLRAAKDLGRKAIGIEIEEKYCEIAAKRMRKPATGDLFRTKKRSVKRSVKQRRKDAGDLFE